LKILQNQGSTRISTIALYAATYNKNGFQGSDTTSQIIKDDGTTIIVVNYGIFDNTILTPSLKNISSPGYYYNSTQSGLRLSLSYAFSQINCNCPSGYAQLIVERPANNNHTKYADCYFTDGTESYASIANDVCSPGTLIALTSQEKLNLITDVFMPTTLLKKKKFTTGLHKSTDSTWKWWDYDGTEYPLGSYPPMSQSPASGDNYGYMFNSYGFNWNLTTGNDQNLPYICQVKACDTLNNVCGQRKIKKV
jgi:hypothetical protein